MLSKPKGIVSVILCLLIINLFTLRTEEVNFLHEVCSNKTAFTPNTIYQKNLNQLFSVLSSNATRPNGFYYATTGNNDPGNKVYGLFLCRGDVNTSTCQQCVDAATQRLRDKCPVEKESIIWYDECLLRYSDVTIFSTVDTSSSFVLHNTGDVSEPALFMQLVDNITASLIQEASNGGSDKKFGTEKFKLSPFQDLYTLVQCTPDLSVSDCNQCLQEAAAGLHTCCNGKQGGRVVYPSCNVRYELYSFYDSSATPPPPPPASTPGLSHIGNL